MCSIASIILAVVAYLHTAYVQLDTRQDNLEDMLQHNILSQCQPRLSE